MVGRKGRIELAERREKGERLRGKKGIGRKEEAELDIKE